MQNKIKNIITNFKIKLHSLDYLPRWIILCIDVFVVFFTIMITYLMMLRVGMYYIYPKQFYIGIVIITSIHLLFFVLFKIYSGIIRHSSMIDGVKIFITEVIVFSVLFTGNLFYKNSDDRHVFLNTGLLLNIILIFSSLFIYRIIVKYIFDKYLRVSEHQKILRVMIYGSDANAISVANAITQETPLRYKLVGFIDSNNKNKNKRLLDLPIYQSKKKTSILLRSQSADALIISDKRLSKEEQNEIVDDLLEYNFKVLVVPEIENWNDRTEISKKIQSIKIEDLLNRKQIVLNNDAIKKIHLQKCVLVTGAAGSIGSEIVTQILNYKPEKIILFDQAETPLYQLLLALKGNDYSSDIIPIIGDIKDKNLIENIFEQYKPNLVYHAAAYKHVPLMEENPNQAVQTNVFGTKILADASLKYNVSKFVMISTDKAVNPSNVMGASKRIAEIYVQSLFLHHKTTQFITTRFGNVLGSNGSVVPLFTKQIKEGGPITITHPDIIRYFMTIPEACQLVLEAGTMGNGGEIYIFDMGKPVKIIDLAYKMIKLVGLIPEKDIKIKFVGLRPGEKLYEELLTDKSKTLATHHSKIMISEDETYEFSNIEKDIKELQEYSTALNSILIVKKMKSIVPEYKSINSDFEKLDN